MKPGVVIVIAGTVTAWACPGTVLADDLGPILSEITMASVPPGDFIEGDAITQRCESTRRVTITDDFGIGTHEITNAQYIAGLNWALDAGLIAVTPQAVIETSIERESPLELVDLDDPDCEIRYENGTFVLQEAAFARAMAYPDGYDPSDHPVKKISWYGAASFCNWLSLYMGRRPAYDPRTWECGPGGDVYDADGFRLPTEAEWEYVAQFDDDRKYAWGSEPPTCDRANFWPERRCVGWTQPVGTLPEGRQDRFDLPIYDLAGNVWEWCHDGWKCIRGNENAADPIGLEGSPYRAVRGGAWGADDLGMRIAIRLGVHPHFSATVYGFRIARSR